MALFHQMPLWFSLVISLHSFTCARLFLFLFLALFIQWINGLSGDVVAISARVPEVVEGRKHYLLSQISALCGKPMAPTPRSYHSLNHSQAQVLVLVNLLFSVIASQELIRQHTFFPGNCAWLTGSCTQVCMYGCVLGFFQQCIKSFIRFLDLTFLLI